MIRARSAVLALVALTILTPPGRVTAQTSRWGALTSLQSVRSVAAGSQTVWVATSGGVFGYDTGTTEIFRFTAVDGLHSVDTRTVAVDEQRSVVWIGYQDGVIDRLDSESGEIRTYLDIERARQFSSRGINRILVRGDSLLIATDFGLVVFDPVRAEVRDAYTRLGTFTAAVAVHDLIEDDVDGTRRLWLATDEGVAAANVKGLNLQDPSSWSNETVGPTGGARQVWSIARFRDRLYVGTDKDLYERVSGSLYVPQSISSFGVMQLAVKGDVLYGAETFTLVTVSADGSVSSRPVEGHEAPTTIAVSGESVWMGDNAAGLAEVALASDGTVFEAVRAVIPDGPSINQFSDLAFAQDGTLWAGGTSQARSGFHRLSADGVWTAFTEKTTPLMVGRARFTSVHAAADGSGWAASEGDGVARVEPDGTLTIFEAGNSSLEPATGTSNFIIAGGVSSDKKGNVWITTRAAGHPLHVRSVDGTWTALSAYVGDGLTARSTAYGSIMVDSYGQKWIILRDENNFSLVRGLMVLDTGSTAEDQSDDRFRFFEDKGSAGQGLPGTSVSAVVEDRDGLVWIGTDSGIAYFLNTGVVAKDASARPIWPPWADRSEGTFVLFGLKVNDLAVDPSNRLWIATDEGAWLIAEAEAGYELIHHFTAENSPLFSDIVESLAVDAGTGRVLFSTDRGLVAWKGDAVAPAASVSDLFVYPNPFRPLEETGPVVISGLVEETDVRIVTPGGIVVASFRARGGQATWDGMDRDGRPAPSGVYIVVAVGTGDEGTAYGRIALIR